MNCKKWAGLLGIVTVFVLLAGFAGLTGAGATAPLTFGYIYTVSGNGTGGYSGDNGTATSAKLNAPRGVAVDNGGNIFIADTNNHRIRRVDAVSGNITTVAGTGTYGYSGDNGTATSAMLHGPYGVAVDSGGNIFIADTGNNCIRRVDTAGIITTVAGTGTADFGGDNGTATSAKLYNPRGVTVDSGGNIFIDDAGNQRIRKVDAVSGNITTMAGNGTGGYSGDNVTATSARLYAPNGVAVDSAGNIFIADTGNQRIRKVVGDATPPSISVNIPSSGAFYRQATMPAAFSGQVADDSAGYGLQANSTAFTLKRASDAKYWDGSTWQSAAAWLATVHAATSDGTPVAWTSSAVMPAWADGDYTMQARATDRGLSSSYSGNITFTYDATLPTYETVLPVVSVSLPASGELFAGGAAASVTWSASDAHLGTGPVAIECYNGTAWVPVASGEANDGVYALTVPSFNTSTAKIRVTVTDRAGNAASAESGAFTIDSTPPVVTIDNISDNVSSLPFITGLVSDAMLDNVQVVVSNTSNSTSWNGSAWVSGETWLDAFFTASTGKWVFIMPPLSDNSSYTVKALATDKAGNLSTIATDSFTCHLSIPGDVNGDGVVDVLDMTEIAKMILKLPPYEE